MTTRPGVVALSIVLGVGASGCGSTRARDPVIPDSPDVPPVQCGELPPAGPPQRLALNVTEHAFAACGRLIAREGIGAHRLWVAPPSLDSVDDVGEGVTRASLSSSGEWLGWVSTRDGREDAALHLARPETARTPIADVPLSGDDPIGLLRVPDDSDAVLAWTCGREGLSVADESGALRSVDPGAACSAGRPVVSSRDVSVVAYEGEGHVLRFADLASDRAGSVDGADYQPNGGAGIGRTARRDFLHVSADGRALVHQPISFSPCGDTECRDPDVPAGIVALDDRAHTIGAAPAHLPDSMRMFEDDATTGSLVAAARGHVMLIGGPGGATLVDASLAVRSLANDVPIHVTADGRFAVVRRHGSEGDFPYADSIVRIDLERGAETTLLAEGAQDDAIVSTSGSAAALPSFTRQCIWHPDHHACHAQIWELAVWTAGGGTHRVAQSTQPLHPVWVGDDGTVLVEAGILSGPVPESAPEDPEQPTRPGWTHVVRADGTVLTDLAWSPISRVHEGANGLLVVSRYETGIHHLDVLDVTTGRTAPLATGSRIEVALDASGERIAWNVEVWNGPGEDPPPELWAGAIPRP